MSIVRLADDALKIAADAGWVVVLPRTNELQIDIDNAAGLDIFTRAKSIFHKHICQILEEHKQPSKSRAPDKFHITLLLARKITAKERILFQVLLGSDPMREILSFVRLDQGDAHPTLFFERRDEGVLR